MSRGYDDKEVIVQSLRGNKTCMGLEISGKRMGLGNAEMRLRVDVSTLAILD